MNVPTNCPYRRLNQSVTADRSFFESPGEFIECVFLNFTPISSSGGAIFVNTSSISTISIYSCQFNNISITGSNRGGGIYIKDVGRVRIESSLLYNTSSGYGGGGIHVESISSCCLIHNCDFQDSSASYVAGGIYLKTVSTVESCSTDSSFGTVFSCFFFHCSLPSHSGGGIYIESPPSDGCVRSCLFHYCLTSSSASWGGGGIYFLYVPSLDEDEFLVYFSLFHENDSNKGKDICMMDSSFFFFSFLFLLFYQCR
jgi:hypothetical protein